jgi:hypothetical protein
LRQNFFAPLTEVSPSYPQTDPIPKTNPLICAQIAIAGIVDVSTLLAAIYMRKRDTKQKTEIALITCHPEK